MNLEAINQSLFLALNAPIDLSRFHLALAKVASNNLIVVLMALLALNCLLGGTRERRALLDIVLAVLLALGLNYVLGLVFPHPRPFMIGLGHTLVPHRAEGSFPSDHASAMWTIACGMMLWSRARWSAWLAVTLAALTSWARVFLGLHFPFDILGSMATAVFAVGVVAALRPVIGQNIWQQIDSCYARVAKRVDQRRDRHGDSK